MAINHQLLERAIGMAACLVALDDYRHNPSMKRASSAVLELCTEICKKETEIMLLDGRNRALKEENEFLQKEIERRQPKKQLKRALKSVPQ